MRGRPTDLTPEATEKALEYVNGAYQSNGEPVPSIAGLAVYVGTSRKSIYEWIKKSEDFRDIYENVLARQELALVSGGLSGNLNSTITKLMLTKHGYSDKQETELSGPAGGPLVSEVVLKIVDPAN